MSDKLYTIQRSKAAGGPIRKTEKELTEDERQGIVSVLMLAWDSCTTEAQEALLSRVKAEAEKVEEKPKSKPKPKTKTKSKK